MMEALELQVPWFRRMTLQRRIDNTLTTRPKITILEMGCGTGIVSAFASALVSNPFHAPCVRDNKCNLNEMPTTPILPSKDDEFSQQVGCTCTKDIGAVKPSAETRLTMVCPRCQNTTHDIITANVETYGVDVNPFAVRIAQETYQNNGVHGGIIQNNLLNGLVLADKECEGKDLCSKSGNVQGEGAVSIMSSDGPSSCSSKRLFAPGSVDIVIFNHPYVPTSDEELEEAIKGCESVDEGIRNTDHLSRSSIESRSAVATTSTVTSNDSTGQGETLLADPEVRSSLHARSYAGGENGRAVLDPFVTQLATVLRRPTCLRCVTDASSPVSVASSSPSDTSDPASLSSTSSESAVSGEEAKMSVAPNRATVSSSSNASVTLPPLSSNCLLTGGVFYVVLLHPANDIDKFNELMREQGFVHQGLVISRKEGIECLAIGKYILAAPTIPKNVNTTSCTCPCHGERDDSSDTSPMNEVMELTSLNAASVADLARRLRGTHRL